MSTVDPGIAGPTPLAIFWARDDLRLDDNPALTSAITWGAENKVPVVAVFILDEESDDIRPLGAASKWWLHHSLTAFETALRPLNIPLVLRRGRSHDVWTELLVATNPQFVAWNRGYNPAQIARDTAIKAMVSSRCRVETFNANLLHEPVSLKNQSGQPFKVFTPFWKACQAVGLPQPLVRSSPAATHQSRRISLTSDRLDDWHLCPTKPDWAKGFSAFWQPGEAGATTKTNSFITDRLHGYATGRDRPDQAFVSALSPHLRFGEVSPRRLAEIASEARDRGAVSAKPVDKFIAELGWRDFSWHLLHQFPDLATRNFRPEFDLVAWRHAPDELAAWQKGLTGYPIVDAGMRQLWQTGYMHNRVRMVVASFLVKHLLIDWREGERWFWDCLLDADPASNPASWQWVAGTGADAAPYFRIFNPVLQGEKFDPDGVYVRRFVPELAKLPANLIHKPWTGSFGQLSSADVILGKTYPKPMVDHDFARQRALETFSRVKQYQDLDTSAVR